MVVRAVVTILFLAWMRSGWSHAATAVARLEDVTPSAIIGGILPKTVTSSKMRLVIAIGLEGTGHDFALTVSDLMFQTHPELPRIDDGLVGWGHYHVPWLMGRSPEHYAEIVAEARQNMKRLREEENLLNDSMATMVLMHGKYSYPNGWGPHKVFGYLDLGLLAEVAEAEGVDFRVLYLRRPARDIVVADTVHRDFHNWLDHAPGKPGTELPAYNAPEESRFMRYMQILFTNAAVVHSFLGEMDRSFVVCHDFGRLGDANQASQIAEVLAPNSTVAGYLARSFVEAVKVRSVNGEEPLPFQSENVVVARLQRKMDAFESVYCRE